MRTALLFAACFFVIWALVSMLLLSRFKQMLLAAFDEQIQARAYLVADKTNLQPRIVPLPQGAESFTILYTFNSTTDTLFRPVKVLFAYPAGADSITSSNGWRSIHIKRPLENGGNLEVIYALPSESTDRKLNTLFKLIWLVLPAGCVIAAVIGYWLSSRLLKPVRQVVDLARSINLNNDTHLLPEPVADDELKELIVSFNRMLLRIEEQSERQTAFFASASHELRTPLSLMQTRLQVLMQEQQQVPGIIELYGEQLKEVKQMNKMVNDFLLLSEVRTGNVNLFRSIIDLPDFLLEEITRYKTKAEVKQSHFRISYNPAEAQYELNADEEKLSIIIGNLLDNAIKYSPANTKINIRIAKEKNGIDISITNVVRDDISPQLTNLKDQFYHSKPIHGEGFGLGLWIANQLAILHGFNLDCTMNNKIFSATLSMRQQHL